MAKQQQHVSPRATVRYRSRLPLSDRYNLTCKLQTQQSVETARLPTSPYIFPLLSLLFSSSHHTSHRADFNYSTVNSHGDRIGPEPCDRRRRQHPARSEWHRGSSYGT